VGAWRLSLVAVVSSLAQGATAIALVGAGVWVFALGRAAMTDLADRLLTPLSFAAIALIGLWLVWRGLRGLAALTKTRSVLPHHHHDAHDPPHDPSLGGDAACAQCGHAHGPDPVRLAAATGWRDMAMLVGAVAIRPCTGALFILILTAQMGMFAVGVAGTLAMALGTASVTVAVALAAVTLRRGALVGLAGSSALARLQPMIEIAVGVFVAVLAGQVALGSF
jgi:ABC-type nickel/cobalt efflux system permease component RcnA